MLIKVKEQIIFSWSGGKDSAMCLYGILNDREYDVMCLLTNISEPYQRISMHGVRVELLHAQADSIGLPLVKMQVPETPTMEVYERVMNTTMTGLKTQGATGAVYGDIFLADLRKYRESQMAELNLKAIFPLWGKPTSELIREFIDLGFKAVITCVNEMYLDKSFAGRILDIDCINDLPENVDPCGENGEYHTFVFDGPIFKRPISFIKGDIVYKKYSSSTESAVSNNGSDPDNTNANSPFENGFWYCDLLPAEHFDSNRLIPEY
jgi:uncharacterized protein (TIGR00290 family)